MKKLIYILMIFPSLCFGGIIFQEDYEGAGWTGWDCSGDKPPSGTYAGFTYLETGQCGSADQGGVTHYSSEVSSATERSGNSLKFWRKNTGTFSPGDIPMNSYSGQPIYNFTITDYANNYRALYQRYYIRVDPNWSLATGSKLARTRISSYRSDPVDNPLFSLSTTNTGTNTYNVNWSTQTVNLESTGDPSNNVTVSFASSNKTIADLQAACAGKGWTVTPSTNVSTSNVIGAPTYFVLADNGTTKRNIATGDYWYVGQTAGAQFVANIGYDADGFHNFWLGRIALTCSIEVKSPIVSFVIFSQKNITELGFKDGGWHYIEYYLYLGTNDTSSDAVYRLWIDGIEQYISTEWVPDTQTSLGRYDLPWYVPSNFYFREPMPPGVGNSGSSYSFPTDGWYAIEFDDYVVSTTYIGPLGITTGITFSPAGSHSITLNPEGPHSFTKSP